MLKGAYRLCDQTVTVYHREGLTRQVYRNAFYNHAALGDTVAGAVVGNTEFLLILPGDADIAPGDKILPGEGPQVRSAEEFGALTYHRCPGMGLAARVRKRCLGGKVWHTEVSG